MGIDSSIAMGFQQPQIQNPMDIAAKALTLKDLSSRSQMADIQNQSAKQEFDDNQAMRAAVGQHTSVDENGNASINKAGVLSDLAKSSPSMVSKAAQNFAAQDLSMQKQKMEMQHSKWSALGQVMGGANDQKSWEDALTQAKSLGVATDQLPQQYDPSVKNRLMMASMDAKSQLEQQSKELDVQNKAQQMRLDSYKTFGNPGGGMKASGGESPNPPGYVPPTKPGEGPKLSKSDPSSFLRNAPPDQQMEMAKEIKHAQNISELAPDLIDAKNRADAALMKNDLKGFQAQKKRFEGLAGAAFKEQEGAARQSSVDHLIESFGPHVMDRFSEKIQNGKGQGLAKWLSGNVSAPISFKNGVDLSKFESTKIDPDVLASATRNEAPTQHMGNKTETPKAPTQASVHPALHGKSLEELKALEQSMIQKQTASNTRPGSVE